MTARTFQRFHDLQAFVGWSPDDAARIRNASKFIEAGMDALIDDFYAEIQRHPDTMRVITEGQSQVQRIVGSLRAWLRESLECRSDLDYFLRRSQIGLRLAQIGLNPAYTAAAMSKL